MAEQLKSDAAKALLSGAIASAVEKKVFGSPFVVIDGEPFFGVDRLPQIVKKLETRDEDSNDITAGDSHEA